MELKIGTLLLSAYVFYVYDYFNLYIIFKVGTTILFPPILSLVTMSSHTLFPVSRKLFLLCPF